MRSSWSWPSRSVSTSPTASPMCCATAVSTTAVAHPSPRGPRSSSCEMGCSSSPRPRAWRCCSSPADLTATRRPRSGDAVGWCLRTGRIGMIYTFNRYELDLDQYELRRDGERIAVEPQVFDVLAHLVEHRTRVVS